MSDTETPTDGSGEPHYTTEGFEVIEELRTYSEGDDVTIHTDEGPIGGQITNKHQTETELSLLVDPFDPRCLYEGARLSLDGGGEDHAGWSVTAGLFGISSHEDIDLGRVRSVSQPDDSDDGGGEVEQ